VPIYFHVELPRFKFKNTRAIKLWLNKVCRCENALLGTVNIIAVSDRALFEMNQTYLQHDYLTDVLSFGDTIAGRIVGDIYISIDRIRENAEKYNVPFDNELRRIIVHGMLHLIGYEDDTLDDKKIMSDKEDQYLAEFPTKG
jgi:rRNA maturation RNase YbeY